VSNRPSHSTQPSTHHMDEYHDDIQRAGAPRVAYPDVMLGEKNEARDVLFFFFLDGNDPRTVNAIQQSTKNDQGRLRR
jgi:hypothetical protein